MNADLPDPFLFENGSRVRTAAEWGCRAKEICDLIVDLEYGGLPPAPSAMRCELLHTAPVERFGDVRYLSCRVVTGPDRPVSFLLNLHVPGGRGPFAVVLNGDACWRHVTDEAVADVLCRGNILAQFNRVEIAADVREGECTNGMCPAGTEPAYGALAAWAWGYHRCVDVLDGMDFVDGSRIAIVGHSRGGKAALLAGATDQRIALVCANGSGCGGAGSHRWQGAGSERLADIIGAFPHWFGPRLREYVNRDSELPFDQHFLKALIAPRALLTTEALGDLWANPAGTWQTHLAAREVYQFLGAGERIGIWYREGGHVHNAADWRAFLDFLDWQFRGMAPECRFDTNPFPDLPKAFTWSAPG